MEAAMQRLHLPGVPHLPCLTELRLGGVELCGPLAPLSTLTRLQLLCMTHVTLDDEGTADGLADALRGMTGLETLCLGQLDPTDRIPEIGLVYLALDSGNCLMHLSRLTTLTLSNMGVRDFTCSKAWGALQHLGLSGNHLGGPPGGLGALRALRQLDVSDQRGVQQFDLAGPLDWARGMPGLKLVKLAQTTTAPTHCWSPGSLRWLMDAEEWGGPHLRIER